ncbi:hypothetical protein SAMN04487981_111313 [Streptomyces sp. cf386]|nr:hypothetical protein [Streptomyces sp. cf386]SDO57954.1 hypothetical protein SAMN04487981_111313 [Streptomyces sp. cf386]
MKAAAHALGTDSADKTEEDRASTAFTAVIQAGQAGQASGDLHPDVTVQDIYLLYATAPADQPPAARARWLPLVLPGLTTRARTVEG